MGKGPGPLGIASSPHPHHDGELTGHVVVGVETGAGRHGIGSQDGQADYTGEPQWDDFPTRGLG